MIANHSQAPAQAQAAPQAGILVIGAELLSGKIVDANGPYLIKALRARGIEVAEVRILPDEIPRIVDAIREFCSRYTYVISTGGIGPTHDDLTIEAVAQAFDVSTVRHPELWSRIEKKFSQRAEEFARLAIVPANAKVELLPSGFLPSIQVENLSVLPGVPEFMRQIFEFISRDWKHGEFVSQAVVVECSENRLAKILETIQAEHPQVAIGSYPRFDEGVWSTKITFDGRESVTVIATKSDFMTWLNQESIPHRLPKQLDD